VITYRFMHEHRGEYAIAFMAGVLGVSTSGYYDWRSRVPSARDRRREELGVEIRTAHERTHGIYGSRKLARELAARGVGACRNTVAKVMRSLGLRSRAQKRRRVSTTDSAHAHAPAPNTLDRRFEARAPDRKWVADITYIPTEKGFMYLATVMDLFSRRIVGWSVSESLETSVVLEALDRALDSRRPGAGLLHHSDRGVQYASGDHRARLAAAGIECSMSRRGNCWDNAPMERFFASLKHEWLNHRRLAGLEELRSSVFGYIEVFYNRERRHQALGYISPHEFETRHAAGSEAA